ncbi:putative RING zinc finger domain superfamily protein isoform X2 [Zea mays]|uniref:putative RING zinc finger domain superfamily protein isoform X2 n=1 Tax=Zea mays TaxID=4577 RepID=UPI0009AADDE6|nr:putative RING zinc finger domain superfamily protein isoform X2 [Zea mays]|eukprot:XP_020403176.1 putative RING zinc finger domain superfamily protein isoform X2 [Zea mays]
MSYSYPATTPRQHKPLSAPSQPSSDLNPGAPSLPPRLGTASAAVRRPWSTTPRRAAGSPGWASGASTTGGGAGSARPAAATSSTAAIATTSPRKTGTSWIGTTSNRLSASSVTPSSRSRRCAATAASAWGSTSAQPATSWTMTLTRSSSIATIAASAGSCYSTTLRDRHCCIENSMKNNCPICYEAVPVRFAEGDVGAPLRPHHAPAVLPRDVEARQVLVPHMRHAHLRHGQVLQGPRRRDGGKLLVHGKEQSSPLVFSYKWHRSRERRLGSGRRRPRPPDAKTLGNKIRRVSGSVPVLIDARVCVCAGAGMGRVQRLQGHDAGLLRHGGPQVLPLPVPQHLPGGTPRPPVATTTTTSLLLELDAASQDTPGPSSYAIITSSACAFTHRSVPVHDELHNFVPCRYVRTLLLEIGRFIRLGTHYLYHNKTRVTLL